jgi:hypothetical protein
VNLLVLIICECHNKVPIFNSNPVTQFWASFTTNWRNKLYPTAHTLRQNAFKDQFFVKYLWLFSDLHLFRRPISFRWLKFS